MKEKILQCFANLGCIIEDENANFNVSDYIEDSITFVSFLVELEQTFDIEIPDDFLIQGKIETFEDLINIIESLINEK